LFLPTNCIILVSKTSAIGIRFGLSRFTGELIRLSLHADSDIRRRGGGSRRRRIMGMKTNMKGGGRRLGNEMKEGMAWHIE
jgi:hypothetical protein